MLEPRRLAARAAAERMAVTARRAGRRHRGLPGALWVEGVAPHPDRGDHRGYFHGPYSRKSHTGRCRSCSVRRVPRTLAGCRSGLALARDAQQGLREELRLLVMSATIDGARIAKALGEAPVIQSEGKAFAVETRYLGRNPDGPIEAEVIDAVLQALRTDTGSILAFLPGAGEIRRSERLVRERVYRFKCRHRCPVRCTRCRDAASCHCAFARGRRKVVLATSIAETSITIDGVRVVIDCGFARVPRYEPAVGLTRLETVRVSRAAADQRRGRAGRVEPGICYRLWDEAETGAMPAYPQPEILAADLSSLVLDLAQWGVREPATAHVSRSAAGRGVQGSARVVVRPRRDR